MSVDVSHVLAGSDAETEQLQEISEIYEDIPIIRGDEWVILSIKCGQLLPTSCFEAAPSKVSSTHIFKGLHFSVSGLPSKDVNRLWALIRTHGGLLSRELRNNTTTHLISGSKMGVKYQKALLETVSSIYLVSKAIQNKTWFKCCF